MNENRIKKAGISNLTLLWILLFTAAFILMLCKLPYGFGGDDEGFYLSVAHRLVLGDRLFSDEWHLSQLSSFFTYPILKLFMKFNGGTEAVLLFFRLCYVLIHSAVSAVVYFRLKKYGFGAVAASIALMLYTPLGMMTLSYNTLAIDFLSLYVAFLGGSEKISKAALIAAGAAFACAVVCCPYLAAAYLFYIIAVLTAAQLRKRGRKFTEALFDGASFLWFTLGIMIPFVIFMLFFFRHSGVRDVIDNLPGIFSDPEHPPQSLFFKFKRYFYCLATAHRFMILPLGVYALLLLSLAADRKRKEHDLAYFVFSILAALGCWLLFAPALKETYFNGFILPLALPGFCAYVFLDKKPVKLFVSSFVTGIIYSFCVCATSNMGFIVLSMAFVVVNISSAVFISLFLRQIKGESNALARIARTGCALCFAVLAVMLIYVKAEYCFWDLSPRQLESRIEVGPAKGIVTSQGAKQSYELICADLEYYDDKQADEILMYTQSAWSYLILEDYPYATFSAWLSGLSAETEERLALYYSENPEKYPRYVCVPKPSAFGELLYSTEEIIASAEKYGYSFEEDQAVYRLEKLP